MRRRTLNIYIVQKGDTLWNIAKKFGVSFEQLKRLNMHLANPDYIVPGMEIFLPDDSKAEKQEDSLARILPQNKRVKEQPIRPVPVKESPQPPKEAPVEPKPQIMPQPPVPQMMPMQPIPQFIPVPQYIPMPQAPMQPYPMEYHFNIEQHMQPQMSIQQPQIEFMMPQTASPSVQPPKEQPLPQPEPIQPVQPPVMPTGPIMMSPQPMMPWPKPCGCMEQSMPPMPLHPMYQGWNPIMGEGAGWQMNCQGAWQRPCLAKEQLHAQYYEQIKEIERGEKPCGPMPMPMPCFPAQHMPPM